MTNKRNSYAFWLGFLIAIIIIAGFSIYFYQGNKDKKLKDIKSELEKFVKTRLNCRSKSEQIKKPTVVKKYKPVPKKFISKR